MKKVLFLGILLVLIHGLFGAASAAEPTAVSTFDTIGLSWSPDGSDQSCDTPATVYDPADFDHVFDGVERTSTLRLVGHEWDNTLVQNCSIHDTGSDGIYMRDVRNVVIYNCEIWNVGSSEGNRGIKISGYGGGTQDVVIDGNYIHDIPKSGIFSGQTYPGGTEHSGLRILNNRIERTGTNSGTNAHHPIYLQSSEFYIEGNVISGPREGNGISIRSSGVVRCNNVSGTSSTGRPAIRYFGDHDAGASNLLIIENNIVVDDNIGIHLYPPTVTSKSGSSPPAHIVKNFIIRYNTADGSPDIKVDSGYDNDRYSVQVYDNPMSSGGGSSSIECTVQYRELGSSVWKAGSPLSFDDTDNEYTGGMVNLKANTEYEIELSLQTGLKATFTAKTSNGEVPSLSPPANLRIAE